MKFGRRAAAIILSLIMMLTMMPAFAFAQDENAVEEADSEEIRINTQIEYDPAAQTVSEDSGETADVYADEDADPEEADVISDVEDYGEAEIDLDLGIDDEYAEGTDPEEQVVNFMLSEEESPETGIAPKASNSVKGNRLTGKDLTYYNAFRSIIKGVSAKKTASAKKKLALSKITGKRTFTAKQLGVSKIGYRKNGVMYLSSAAEKKITELVHPKDWKRVYTSLLSDLSNESFWVDWHTADSFLVYKCKFKYTTNKITSYSSNTVTCRLAVQPEFQGSKYKADLEKIKNVRYAKRNARYFVDTFDKAVDTQFAGYTDEEIDLYRLYYYCKWIADNNTYNDDAAYANYRSYHYKGPWSWVYVLDGYESTNAVCEGYARALKLLCDMSRFKSDWIDCQILSGKVTGYGTTDKHMWNVVRMNDGLNYLIDPTWMDTDTSAGEVDMSWFLRGAPSGTDNGYTIGGYKRVYDSWTRKGFASAERKLSPKDEYEFYSSRAISLKKTAISKLISGSRSFKVKWKKVTAPYGALYVDGYQIRYSTKKSMSGAKTVTVKGYNSASKTIKKLKAYKVYYVQVRTYAKMGGSTYYSGWSGKKKVRTF